MFGLCGDVKTFLDCLACLGMLRLFGNVWIVLRLFEFSGEVFRLIWTCLFWGIISFFETLRLETDLLDLKP